MSKIPKYHLTLYVNATFSKRKTLVSRSAPDSCNWLQLQYIQCTALYCSVYLRLTENCIVSPAVNSPVQCSAGWEQLSCTRLHWAALGWAGKGGRGRSLHWTALLQLQLRKSWHLIFSSNLHLQHLCLPVKKRIKTMQKIFKNMHAFGTL